MNAQEGNGSTPLEALARRLEALERENAELRGKVAALEGSGGRREEVGAVRGSAPSGGLEGSRISRRRLLGKAGAAAASLVVAGALTQRDIREARAAAPETFTSNVATTPGVTGTNTFGGVGVHGEGAYGVTGTSNPQDGVTGQGVQGNHTGSGIGVMGDSNGGMGVHGRSFGGTTGAVVGQHFGSGYGGQFIGGKAQLRLVPGSTEGRPGGAHSRGEIYMGAKGALFVCVRGGMPGTWRKVTTTAV